MLNAGKAASIGTNCMCALIGTQRMLSCNKCHSTRCQREMQKLYSTGQVRYHAFCQQLHCSPLPSTEQLLLLLVAYLANEGPAHSTIKVYLSALCNLHIITGHRQTFASQLTTRLEQVLQGIKRTQASKSTPRVRLPITLQLMHKIRRAAT